VTTVRLSDGTVVHVRMAKRGAKITEADIKAIEAVRDALKANKVDPLAVCPGCGCYRDRCACDLRESQAGQP
jgi:hypothetical protein